MSSGSSGIESWREESFFVVDDGAPCADSTTEGDGVRSWSCCTCAWMSFGASLASGASAAGRPGDAGRGGESGSGTAAAAAADACFLEKNPNMGFVGVSSWGMSA